MIKFQYRTITLTLLLIGGMSMANAQDKPPLSNTQSNSGYTQTPPGQQVPPPPPQGQVPPPPGQQVPPPPPQGQVPPPPGQQVPPPPPPKGQI